MSDADDVDSELRAALALLDDVQSPLAATAGVVDGAESERSRSDQRRRDDWAFSSVDELLSISMDSDDGSDSTFLAMSLFDSEQQQEQQQEQTAECTVAHSRSTVAQWAASGDACRSSSKRLVRATRTTTASSGPGGRPKSHSNPNKARNERREEVIYLRKKVAELEQQLAAAKERQQKQLLGPSTSDASASAPPSCAPSLIQAHARDPAAAGPNVWADIVRRQQTQRVKAERENIRLKLVLENQLKIAKSLEKMIQKSTSTKEFDKVLPERQRFVWAAFSPPPPPQAADARLIDDLLAGLDQSYVEAESVFEANGLARGVGDVHVSATIHSSDSGGVQLGIVASKVLPFDMRAASAVVWNHFAFAKDRLPNRVYHHNAPQMLNAAEDTLIEDFNLEVVLATGVAMYRERQVMRKYTEEHRVVIVWRGYSDTMQIADEPTGGMRFFERGYIVIRARDGSQSSASSASGQATSSDNVLQTCFLTTPVLSGTLADADARKIRDITDYIIRSAADKIASSHEIIENLLLEQAMKGPSEAIASRLNC